MPLKKEVRFSTKNVLGKYASQTRQSHEQMHSIHSFIHSLHRTYLTQDFEITLRFVIFYNRQFWNKIELYIRHVKLKLTRGFQFIIFYIEIGLRKSENEWLKRPSMDHHFEMTDPILWPNRKTVMLLRYQNYFKDFFVYICNVLKC